MSFVAILGRQPALGIAELEKVFGGKSISILSDQIVKIDANDFEIQNFGGIPKAGKIILELPPIGWHQISQKIVNFYLAQWSDYESKITLGISAYNCVVNAREVQKTGIILKQKLKKYGVSLRLVPSTESALSSAVSHHNKLGLSLNKVELLIIKTNENKIIVAQSTGAQNITAYANRDQKRPKRDAFVGMLPPKLAQIMINLATGQTTTLQNSAVDATSFSNPLEPEFDKAPGPLSNPERSKITKKSSPTSNQTLLDPFCGTGLILQEAALLGYSVYGTDISEKMIRYSRDNLNWLANNHNITFDWYLHEGDAMTTKWKQPINAVVTESYLGQPFSAPPSPVKLDEVVKNCDHIISEFLKNLAPQIKSGTPLCIAIPAWRDKKGHFTHLPLIAVIGRLGYKRFEFKNVSQNDLLYFREDQVVARELLVLTRA